MLQALTRIIAAACLVVLATEATPTIIVPNFRDLMVRTRVHHPPPGSITETRTWYFKGARIREERQDEPRFNQPPPKVFVNLTQCDKKTNYFIDEKELDYNEQSAPEMAAKWRDILKGEPDNGEIVITYDSVDTGERRQYGSYEARHVRTTAMFNPTEDSGLRTAKIELDGWYIDLPGWDMCEDNAGTMAWAMEMNPDHPKPRIIERQRGVRRGFIITETSRTTGEVQSGGSIEFLGISEDPLDPTLFEIPKDYTREPD
jgi:hypothetical protein